MSWEGQEDTYRNVIFPIPSRKHLHGHQGGNTIENIQKHRHTRELPGHKSTAKGPEAISLVPFHLDRKGG